VRQLVRHFSLDYEDRIVFNPDRLADGDYRDLETAILLTVPLKGTSIYDMAATRNHEDEGFDTAIFALPSASPPKAYQRFQHIIKDFQLQPVDPRHLQLHWRDPPKGKTEQDSDPPDGAAFARRLWDRHVGPKRFRSVTLEELPPRWMMYVRVEGSL
jgi:hypothetical protein